jgi:hypothetical protein
MRVFIAFALGYMAKSAILPTSGVASLLTVAGPAATTMSPHEIHLNYKAMKEVPVHDFTNANQWRSRWCVLGAGVVARSVLTGCGRTAGGRKRRGARTRRAALSGKQRGDGCGSAANRASNWDTVPACH